MSWLKKNIIWVILIIVLASVYGTVGYCYLFRNDMSIEYDYYYRDQKTKFWAGDNSLFLNPYDTDIVYVSERAYDTYSVADLNLQYIGKNTKLNTEKETKVLLNLLTDHNFDFYYRLDLDECTNAYVIKINYMADHEVKLLLNGKEYDIDHCVISKDDLKDINHLQLKGTNITINGLEFSL